MLRILALALVALIGAAPVTDPILRDLQQRLSTLEREAVRGKRLADAHDADRLLGPRSLAAPIGVRGASAGGIPDLAAPLTARLRDDAATASFASGRMDAGYANVLADPLFDGIPEINASPVSIGTSYTAIGSEWEAKYILNSGTAPVVLDVGLLESRTDSYQGRFSSIAMIQPEFGANDGDITVYFRPADTFTLNSLLGIEPGWLVAGMLIWPDQTNTSNITVTAYLEIVDSSDTVLATGDSVDMVALEAALDVAQVAVGLEEPDWAEAFRFRLRLDISKTAGIGARAYAFLAEPQLNPSDDGSVPPFTPAIGAWVPTNIPSTTSSALGARVRRTTNQSINDANDTVLNWSSATYDTDSFFDAGTPGRLTVPQDGTYHCTAQVTWAAGAGGNRRDIWFIVNGSTGTIYARGRTNPSGAVQKYAQASIDLSLSAGDYVSCYVHQDSGGALDAVGTDHNTFFAIHKIGGAKGDDGATGPTGTVSTGTVVTATLSADQNDWNPTGLSTAGTLRIDPSGGSWTVTGLAAQADGTVLFVENVDASANVYIAHDSASSAAANRIRCYDGVDGRLSAGASAWLRYDGTSQRWYLTGQAWNPGEDGDISTLAFGDVPDANQTLSGSEFAPAAHVHGMPANPFPTGAVVPYAGTSAPTGFLLCDGSAVSRTTYADLFAVCSTTYGAGDGSTTFNLPDLRQRFVLGKAASGTGNALGATGGSIDHTHSYSQVVNHTHAVTITDPGHQHGMAEGTTDGAGIFADRSNAAAAAAMVTDSATTGITASTANPAGGVASGTTGSTNPPFIALNFIIKT